MRGGWVDMSVCVCVCVLICTYTHIVYKEIRKKEYELIGKYESASKKPWDIEMVQTNSC